MTNTAKFKLNWKFEAPSSPEHLFFNPDIIEPLKIELN